MFRTTEHIRNIKDIQKKEAFEVLIHGRIPVMQSTQCLKKTTGHCNKTSEEIWLEDKKEESFQLQHIAGNVII